MADTKSARPKSAGATKTRKRSSSATKRSGSKANGSKAKASRTKAKKPATRGRSSTRSANSSSNGVSAGVKSVRDTIGDAGQKVGDVGQKAGRASGEVASKAKVPLIAGGAAMLGAASGIALAASRSRSPRVLGVKLPKTKVKIKSKDLVKGADKVARAGEQIGRLSTGLREIQGTSDASNGNGNGHKPSPVEVLIQGLTRRR